MANVVACRGIQHPKLTLHGEDDSIRPFCAERWSFIRGGWHSNDCCFIVAEESPKQRCAKCTRAHSNIRPFRHPMLFPERAVSMLDAGTVSDPAGYKTMDTTAAVSTHATSTPAAANLILSDESAVRCRLIELVDSTNKHSNLSDNTEISLIAKALKLKGQLIFDLDNNRSFTMCGGDDCHSSFIKSKRSVCSV